MPRRHRAPGVDSQALDSVLRDMRAVNAEIRAMERRLAITPPSSQGPLVRRIDRLFGQREAVMNEWVAVSLPRVVRAGAVYAETALGASPSVSALMSGVLAELQRQTFTDVAGMTSFMTADARRFIRDVAEQVTTTAIENGVAIDEAARLVAARLEGFGIREFVDASGRSWGLGNYSEMLVRTRTAMGYNAGTIVRCAELGVGNFEVFDGTEDEGCAEANGTIVDAAWAWANPIEHPNCTRAFGPVSPEDLGGSLADELDVGDFALA